MHSKENMQIAHKFSTTLLLTSNCIANHITKYTIPMKFTPSWATQRIKCKKTRLADQPQYDWDWQIALLQNPNNWSNPESLSGDNSPPTFHVAMNAGNLLAWQFVQSAGQKRCPSCYESVFNPSGC